MEVEQAIFTSADSGLVKGYHLVARSIGLNEDVARELCKWAPTHSSLIGVEIDDWSLNCFPISDDWVALTRTVYGRPEYSGRGGLQIVTIILALRRAQFAAFAYDAWTLARSALAVGCLTLPRHIDPQMPRANLPDRALIRRSRGTPGHPQIQRAAAILENGQKVALLGLNHPFEALEYLIGQLSEKRRTQLSFTTGLTPSVQRPFQLHLLPISDEGMRGKLAMMGAECLDLQSSSPSRNVLPI